MPVSDQSHKSLTRNKKRWYTRDDSGWRLLPHRKQKPITGLTNAASFQLCVLTNLRCACARTLGGPCLLPCSRLLSLPLLLFSPLHYRLSLSALIPLAGALSKANGTEKIPNRQHLALQTSIPKGGWHWEHGNVWTVVTHACPVCTYLPGQEVLQSAGDSPSAL